MEKTNRLALLFVITIILFFSIALNVWAFGISDTGLNITSSEAYGGAPPVQGSLSAVIGKVVGVALSFIGILFLLLMIYGGFTWMIARGNESDVTKAKEIIIAAIIGLIIVLAAYGITSYVGDILLNNQ